MRRETRWLETELPDELQRSLRSLEVNEPVDAQLARMRAQLAVAIGPAFSNPANSSGARADAARPRSMRLISLGKPMSFGTLLAIGVGALWWNYAHLPARDASPPMAAGRAPAVQPGSRIEVVPGTAPAPAVDARQPATESTARLEPSNPPARSAAASARSSENHSSNRRELGLAEELRQLERIRREVARSPRQALVAADAHRKRFPHGVLGPERELLRIEAWLRLGEYDRAQQLAGRVLTTPEASPYSAQVAQLMARYPRRPDASTVLPR